MKSLKQHSKSLFCSVGFIFTALLAGCGGGSDQGKGPILGLPAADLVSVAVTPATASVPIRGTQQFVATATYADGASRDVTTASSWSSGTAAVATVNSATGLATGVASGAAIMTASFGSKTGAATLTVTPATLVSIAVTPASPTIAIAASQQFIANGTFSDGTSRDITATSTFTSGTPAVATVLAGGLATGVTAGSTVITATSGVLKGTANLTVTPATLVSIAITPANPTIQIGASQQFTVTGTYSNNTTANLTNVSTFSTATPAVALVGAATGLSTGLIAGTSVITATAGGKTASTTLTVMAATLNSIAVTPATASIVAGGTQSYVATGTFSDGTTANITNAVSWTSGTTTVATILPTGVATGVAAGTATIMATSGARSGTAALTVTAATTLTSIAVTPATSSIAVAGTRQFTATGSFSDATTRDITTTVTWSSGTTTVATVQSTGLATGVSAGNASITATMSGKSGSGALTVTAPVTLTAIAVTPANQTVSVGANLQYAAAGTFSDGSSRDISSSVTWNSSLTSVASISSTGMSSAIATGLTSISATQGTVSGNTSLTVSAVIPPAVVGLDLGRAARFGVLAGTSITNNSGGLTLVTGDVGAPSQTVDPVQTAGFSNFKSGAELSNGLADLDVAITEGNARVCTVSSAAGIDLGGQTFTPGVYCYAGAISVTGTFSLSGPGVYIFRSASTLNTTANSIVALNGASADTVYWIPVGPTTLGANSVFKGTIMGRAAAITMGDMTTLQSGRVLSGAAVTLRNNVIVRP